MNIYVEEFQKRDILQLKLWGKHDDLRFVQYDFARFFDDKNFETWFELKNRERRMLFAIKDDDNVRGFISLRKINAITKSAEFGIAIDPNFTSMGIGKAGLSQFLGFYFNEMKMRKLRLTVSTFNERAVNLYKSLGFKRVKTRLSKFENQMDNFKLILIYDDFKIIGDSLYTETETYVIMSSGYKRENKEEV